MEATLFDPPKIFATTESLRTYTSTDAEEDILEPGIVAVTV